jgi:hypothetical protein
MVVKKKRKKKRKSRKPEKKARRRVIRGFPKEIWSLFIRPFVEYLELQGDIPEAMNLFFNTANRTIEHVRAKKRLVVPVSRVPKIYRREAAKSTVLINKKQAFYVRLDEKAPNRVDIEVAGEVYLIDRDTLDSIKEYLEYAHEPDIRFRYRNVL